MWLSRAIEPALESEKEVNDVTTPHQVMLTADNYELEVEPARDPLNGRDCFVLNLKVMASLQEMSLSFQMPRIVFPCAWGALRLALLDFLSRSLH